MDTQTLKIFAKQNNFLLGVCDNLPLLCHEEYMSYTPFVKPNILERTDPIAVFDQTKSIIVIGVPYGKKYNFDIDTKDRIKISMNATCYDYHKKVKGVLQSLVDFMLSKTSFNYKYFVDSPYLLEKELAKKAGLGFYGKNSTIITYEYGSLFFIGYVLVDLDLEPTPSNINKTCGNCNLCQKACPVNAISKDYVLDVSKCISYLTQKKDLDYNTNLYNCVYGCDMCQSVCPYNQNKFFETIDNIDLVYPEKDFLLSLSSKKLKEFYPGISWVGKKVIDRNIDISSLDRGE